MDVQIKLRNTNTDQTCEFDGPEAAENFAANVDDRAAWEQVDPAPTAGQDDADAPAADATEPPKRTKSSRTKG